MSVAPTFPSLLDLGRHFRAVSARFEVLDKERSRLRDDDPRGGPIENEMRLIDEERSALRGLIFARPAATLEDAAVQAALGFYLAESIGECDPAFLLRENRLLDRSDQLRQAFLSILGSLARATSLDLDEIAWPDLPGVVAELLPPVEG